MSPPVLNIVGDSNVPSKPIGASRSGFFLAKTTRGGRQYDLLAGLDEPTRMRIGLRPLRVTHRTST